MYVCMYVSTNLYICISACVCACLRMCIVVRISCCMCGCVVLSPISRDCGVACYVMFTGCYIIRVVYTMLTPRVYCIWVVGVCVLCSWVYWVLSNIVV